MFGFDPVDFGRRFAVETELEQKREQFLLDRGDGDKEKKKIVLCPLLSNAVFDESDNFIVYPTLAGIKSIILKHIFFCII